LHAIYIQLSLTVRFLIIAHTQLMRGTRRDLITSRNRVRGYETGTRTRQAQEIVKANPSGIELTLRYARRVSNSPRACRGAAARARSPSPTYKAAPLIHTEAASHYKSSREETTFHVGFVQVPISKPMFEVAKKRGRNIGDERQGD
jgi:hypothetical protein